MCIYDIGIMELAGLEFEAFHGCLESERREGNRFVVDFKAAYRLGAAAASDDLADAADYAVIYALIREQMEQPSDLLESVAARIVQAIEARFPQAFPLIKVTVSKCQPPVGGVCAWSRVTAYNRDPVAASQEEHLPVL